MESQGRWVVAALAVLDVWIVRIIFTVAASNIVLIGKEGGGGEG